MERVKPILIAFAGLDGCGKSKQVKLLAERLDCLGVPAITNKAKESRHEELLALLMAELGIPENSLSFMLLYQALHRRQYEKARDALAAGNVVVADRWNESFFVYHRTFGPCAGRNDVLATLDQLAFEGRKPDICFLLDVSVDCAFERRRKRKCAEKVFSERKREFYEAIRKEYLRMAEDEGWFVLDAKRPKEEVHADVCRKVFERLGL
ncbi:MAG: dTMP kinase [bacterium]|nr:dTMP kinase [bacterium]